MINETTILKENLQTMREVIYCDMARVQIQGCAIAFYTDCIIASNGTFLTINSKVNNKFIGTIFFDIKDMKVVCINFS